MSDVERLRREVDDLERKLKRLRNAIEGGKLLRNEVDNIERFARELT